MLASQLTNCTRQVEFALRPERPRYDSPGQRPGYRVSKIRPALKGRNKLRRPSIVAPPLQGSKSFAFVNPGRCPGLFSCAPSGRRHRRAAIMPRFSESMSGATFCAQRLRNGPSRSDGVRVAVGFSPRYRAKPPPRRGATLEHDLPAPSRQSNAFMRRSATPPNSRSPTVGGNPRLPSLPRSARRVVAAARSTCKNQFIA